MNYLPSGTNNAACSDPEWGVLSIAVLIPCYNEEISITTVVSDFMMMLPGAAIYVYDNNSTDRTAEAARAAGAIVRRETRQGKGHVVRRMFADVEADVYVMVDGDDTYDPGSVRTMIGMLLSENLDMVNGARRHVSETAYRPGHKMGNRALTGIVRFIFGTDCRDMLSGYRVFSRRFVKTFPVMSEGFEIETELTIHSLEQDIPLAEVEVAFKERSAGSESKLRTISDGIRILWMITKLLKQERPVLLFGGMAAVTVALALLLATPLIVTYLETGLVPRFPTAILVTGLVIAAMLSMHCGLVLDTVTRGRKEAKRLHYLTVPSMQEIQRAHAARHPDE